MVFDELKLEHIKAKIYDAVYQYAYENSITKYIFAQEAVTDWLCEVFDSKDIKELLFVDIIHYMKEEGIYKRVLEETDTFIVLPDIFSRLKFAKSNYEGADVVDGSAVKDVEDMGFVIINGHLFDIIDRILGGIKFNYNNKMYYFFKKDKNLEVANHLLTGNKLEVVSAKDDSYLFLNEDTPLYDNPSFNIFLGIDNKVLYDVEKSGNGYTYNDEDGNSHYADYINNLSTKYPSITYPYNEEEVRFETRKIVGLHSVTPLDFETMKKIHDELQDKFIVHNRNIVFADTAIIFYKDRTYEIVNDMNNDKFNKIDKHTVEFLVKENSNIKEITLFIKPIYIGLNEKRVDSMYDILQDIHENAYFLNKEYKKNTFYLLNWLNATKRGINELIEYGYKYDLDLLRVIKLCFPTSYTLSGQELEYLSYTSKEDPNGNMYADELLFVSIVNPLHLHPLIFLRDDTGSGVLFNNDTNIYHNDGFTIVQLKSPDLSLNELYTKIIRNGIRVALFDSTVTNEYDHTFFLEQKTSINKKYPMIIMDDKEMHKNSTLFYKGKAVVNGYNHSIRNILPNTIFDGKLITFKEEENFPHILKLNHNVPIEKLVINNRIVEITSGVPLHSNGFLVFDIYGNEVTHKFTAVTDDTLIVTENLSEYALGKDYYLIQLPLKNSFLNIDMEIDMNLVVDDRTSYNEYVLDKEEVRFLFRDNPFINNGYTHNVPLDTKDMEDVILSYGFTGNTPFNPTEYDSYLINENIAVLEAGYELSSSYEPLYRESVATCSIMHLIASNVYMATNITSAEIEFHLGDYITGGTHVTFLPVDK